LSVGATLERIANGEVEHLTREEVFGLAHTRFLKTHGIPLAYQERLLVHIATAVRYRNSKHPHVKKLGLTSIMASHDARLKELYQHTVEKAMARLRALLATHNIATAEDDEAEDDEAEDDDFGVTDITKEGFLSILKAELAQTKPEFRAATEAYMRQAFVAGRTAGINKLVKAGVSNPPAKHGADDDDYIRSQTDTDSMYYGQMLDDVEDDAREAMGRTAPDEQSWLDMVEAALFGQGYRTDLYTNNLYRAAQDGQGRVFDEHKEKDPAGAEWKYKWVAVMDDNTCEICADLNGTVQYIDGFEYDPGDVHYFCRCDLDPIPPEEEEDPKPDDEPDDEPDNEGTPPGGPDYDPPDPVDGIGPDGTYDLFTRVSEDQDTSTAIHMLNHKAVEEYRRTTPLRDKLEHIKSGDTLIGRYMGKFAGEPEALIEGHFQDRHNLAVGGGYSHPEFWGMLKPKDVAREMDMLIRVDTTLDAMKSGGLFKRIFDEDRVLAQMGRANGLGLTRIVGTKYADGKVIKNTAFFNRMSNNVYLHNKTFRDLALHADVEKNKIIAHEFTHAFATAIQRNPDGEMGRMWRGLQMDWDALNRRAVREGIDGFVSYYGKESFIKKKLGEEDLCEGVASYIYAPKTFEKNALLQEKYQLLKDKLFGGQEFTGYNSKPLL